MPNGPDYDIDFLAALNQFQAELLRKEISAMPERLVEVLQNQAPVSQVKLVNSEEPTSFEDSSVLPIGHDKSLQIKWINGSARQRYQPFVETCCAALNVSDQQKNYEGELELYKKVIEATEDGYWEWFPIENRSFFSESLKKMFGYEDHEVGNDLETWASFIHPEDQTAVLESSADILKNPYDYHEIEFRMRCKDGSYKWVLSRGKPMEFTEDGKVLHVIGTQIDIQNKKELEESLRRANQEIFLEKELLTKTSELAKMGSWEVDLDDNTVFWSDITKKIHEVKAYYEPNIESGIQFYKEGWSRDLITKLFERCINEGEPFDDEFIIITENGNEKWVRALGDKDKTDNAKNRLFGLFQDIDETKRTQDELERVKEAERTTLERLSLAAETAEIGVWDWELESNTLTWDDRMYLLYGMKREDYDGANDAMTHIFHPDDRLPTREKVQLAIEGKQPFDCEFRIVRPNGQERTIKAKASVLRDSSGKAVRMIGVNSDITDAKHLSQEQDRARQAAEDANESKSQFLANMSHEIRTPMNGVLGMLHLALQTKLDDKTQKKLNIALKSAKSLLTIINDILDFSKIEANKLTLENTNFSITEVLENCINNLVTQAAGKGLDFRSDLGGLCGSYVKGDPVRVEQIINNLLSNAVKFTESGKVEIVANLVDYGKMYKFNCSVIDSGIGIPKDKQEGLFEAFSQVDASTTRKFGGTGLGLAICKKLSRMMDGDIRIESDGKSGSTFTVELGLQKAGGAFKAKEYEYVHNKNIVIIDSNENNFHTKAFRRVVEKLNAKVLEISAEALETGNYDREISNASYVVRRLSDTQSQTEFLDSIATPQVLIKDTRANTDTEGMSETTENKALRFLSTPIQPSLVKDCLSDLNKFNEGRSVEVIEDNERTSVESSAKILVVDDNESNLEVAAGLLEIYDHNCDVADNGKKAIEKLISENTGKYKLVFMDVQMPIMNGYEATEKIRLGAAGEHYKDVTIVAMTANAMVGDKEKCLEAGMNAYLPKPIDPDALEKVLKQYLPHQ